MWPFVWSICMIGYVVMTHRMDPQFQQSWCVNTLYYNITTHFFSNTLHLRQKLAQHFISQWVNINWIFIGLDSWRWMSYKKQERLSFESTWVHPGLWADIDLRQKCIHFRHNLFAPILLLRHLFVQATGFICANKIAIAINL